MKKDSACGCEKASALGDCALVPTHRLIDDGGSMDDAAQVGRERERDAQQAQDHEVPQDVSCGVVTHQRDDDENDLENDQNHQRHAENVEPTGVQTDCGNSEGQNRAGQQSRPEEGTREQQSIGSRSCWL